MSKKSSGKSCLTLSVGATGLATGLSATSLMLLILSVSTSNWDSVIFDFRLVNASATQAGSGYIGLPRQLYADSAKTQLAGLILLTSNSTGFCLLNLYSSLWSQCDQVQTDDAINADYDTYCSRFSLLINNNSCFGYITGYNDARDVLDNTENTSENQIMKMQNNAMACCIVAYICILTSFVTGTIGVLARVVPSVMVTGVLHLTACIFIVFFNSIVHEKASRMMRRPMIDNCPQCVCYNLVKTPEQYCNSAYRTVSLGWSIAVSWVSAVMYLAASISWFYLTRRMRIDKAKSMV